jgi:hypothetical protein
MTATTNYRNVEIVLAMWVSSTVMVWKRSIGMTAVGAKRPYDAFSEGLR